MIAVPGGDAESTNHIKIQAHPGMTWLCTDRGGVRAQSITRTLTKLQDSKSVSACPGTHSNGGASLQQQQQQLHVDQRARGDLQGILQTEYFDVVSPDTHHHEGAGLPQQLHAGQCARQRRREAC